MRIREDCKANGDLQCPCVVVRRALGAVGVWGADTSNGNSSTAAAVERKGERGQKEIEKTNAGGIEEERERGDKERKREGWEESTREGEQ